MIAYAQIRKFKGNKFMYTCFRNFSFFFSICLYFSFFSVAMFWTFFHLSTTRVSLVMGMIPKVCFYFPLKIYLFFHIHCWLGPYISLYIHSYLQSFTYYLGMHPLVRGISPENNFPTYL